MTKIDVTDAGPIEGTFTIDLSPGPGAYEFRGKRGSGKTTCISSIDWLAGHKVDVTLHDGAVSGKIEGFGVVAPIGGRKRRKGELDLDTIDAEKFSLIDILDPQGKTPEVRDATRIKALAALSDAKADPHLYHELCGGQTAFSALGIDVPSDPVLLATRIKAAFDKQAIQNARIAEAEAKYAAPLEHVPDDLDISGESDLSVLGEARDAARDELHRLKQLRESGLESQKEVAAAKERLEKVRSEYSGPSVKDAEKSRQAFIEKGAAAKARVEELERELQKAIDAVETCKAEYVAANSTYEASKSHEAAIAELESTANQDPPPIPDESELAAASEAVENATVAYNQGVRIRDVKANLSKSTAHRDAEKAATSAAEEARNKAGKVFDVLAQSLQTKHLEIKSIDGNPRLFVQHPKRGRTAFDAVNGLSDGERVDFALRELLPHLESPGLLPIPQKVWQDLQPSDRKRLHELAVDKELFLFGAQVDDEELRVVYLGNGKPASKPAQS
jgi:hypothetical protein